MSAHYYDAGSGPHDTEPRADGLHNCGCQHDGLRWYNMCAAARAASDVLHIEAQREHNAEMLRKEFT